MKPIVLELGVLSFLLCLGLHIVVWHMRHPRKHLSALLAVFLLPLLPFAALILRFCPNLTLLDLAAVGALHLALSCSYIQIYPAAQAFSPTLVILVLVHESMPAGMTRKDLLMRLNDDFLLGPRIQDLLDARLMHEAGGRFQLDPSGARFLQFFIGFRRLLGMGMGRG